MTFSLPPLAISLVRTMGESVNDAAVRSAADSMVRLGLRDAGYEYIIISDAWCKQKRCLKTDSLICDTEKFPEGLSATADHLHSLGLKLGVVASLGARSTTDRPGMFEHEWADVEYLDRAGVDYIACDLTKLPARGELQTPLRRMGLAVRQAQRDIYLAVYTDRDIHTWVRSTGANAFCLKTFYNCSPAVECDPVSAGYSADFCFESCGDITFDSTESLRSQLTIAAAMSSPIVVDCDVDSLSDEALKLMKDPLLLSIMRDEEGRPARRLDDGVYCKMLTDCEYAVALVNFTEQEATRSFCTYDFGLIWNSGYYCEAANVFTGEKTDFSDSLEVTLPAGSSAMYLMRLIER